MKTYEKIEEAVLFLNRHFDPKELKAGVILGSGLGSYGDTIDTVYSVNTSSIPHWPVSTVQGHKGEIIIGRVEESLIAVVQGRVHIYEGYSPEEVVFGVRVLGAMGIKSLIITNAAGSTNPDIPAGSMMLIRDHINMMGIDPLTGPNLDRFGPRFPDMNRAYSAEYRHIALEAASELGINLYQGVLAATHGPSYETPSEVSALKLLGTDAVCMSTIPEVIAANHMGIKVLGISCVTNMASGMSSTPLSHSDVEETANRIAEGLNRLLKESICRIIKNS